jgi:small subunit ribosomal protein S14
MARKALILKAQKPPKYSSRQKNRCQNCGRARAYVRQFGLCRICFRERALLGQLPGIKKSSW